MEHRIDKDSASSFPPATSINTCYNNIFDIPTAILCLIFTQWLTVDSLCAFDSAIINHQDREIFLNLCSEEEFHYGKNTLRLKSTFFLHQQNDEAILNAEWFLRWLHTRNISIRHITLSCWNNVTDKVFSNLNLRGLRSLTIAQCTQITNRGIRFLSTSCYHYLQNLNLSDCTQITNASIKNIAANCSSLETLNLKSCVKITDKGISLLSKGCSRLKELNLGFCEKITDKGIAAVAQGCNMLQRVVLVWCVQLRDKSIIALSKHCRPFQALNLNSVPKF